MPFGMLAGTVVRPGVPEVIGHQHGYGIGIAFEAESVASTARQVLGDDSVILLLAGLGSVGSEKESRPLIVTRAWPLECLR